jgi:hypothetical protein
VLAALGDRIPLKRVWQPLAVVVTSAIVYAFLDPELGFTLDGFGLVLSLAIAVAITTFAYEGLQSLLSTRRLGAPARIRMLPAAILIAVVCVVISRVMSFQPGYVFGIVGGLTFTTATEPEPRAFGRNVLLCAAVLLAVSLGAWFAAIPVAAAVQSTGGFLLTTLQASLIAVFVMGLEALLFGLLPLGFMDGEKIMRYSKVAWMIAFGVVGFAFWHVLLNPSSKYLDSFSQKSVVMMFALLGAYGLVTLGMYLYFRSPSRQPIAVAPAFAGAAAAPAPFQPAAATPWVPAAVQPAPAIPAPPEGAAGWCNACGSYVSLTTTWGCPNGHGWDHIQNWYDARTGQPIRPYWL